MPVQTSYDEAMQIAMPGMRSDSSLQNTDGTCAAQSAIKAGYAVATVSVSNDCEIVKQVSASTDTIKGIARFSQFGCVTGQYETGDAVNVMTFGRIWAVTNLTAAPTTAATVQVLTSGNDGGKVASTGGTAVPGWSFTGRFTTFTDSTGTVVNLAEVQLREQTATSAA
ncbi:hypothetical protein SAMN05216522_1057 [Rosenbergiella nectarea]|uniref:Uncharacterized protein n=1 Tax=Rosenbergiella nectarea TaxID=988801 RepID=A0A1H9HPX1_9GAMM|nr:hypothetical protein [Rosenbergiella nectarea]SEQ64338.1 hypothetical protein SAMN05216522_1057 [Rosenbergiella nectarea]